MEYLKYSKRVAGPRASDSQSNPTNPAKLPSLSRGTAEAQRASLSCQMGRMTQVWVSSEPWFFVLNYTVLPTMGRFAFGSSWHPLQTHCLCVGPIPIRVLPWEVAVHSKQERENNEKKLQSKKLSSNIQEESLQSWRVCPCNTYYGEFETGAWGICTSLDQYNPLRWLPLFFSSSFRAGGL